MRLRYLLAALVVMLLAAGAAAASPPSPPAVATSADAEARIQALEVAQAAQAEIGRRKSEQRAADDLTAQQQMAASAQHLAGLTLLQVLIAAVGTAVLVWTIMQANTSMKLSAASLDQNGQLVALTQRHAEMQLKAYLDFSRWTVEDYFDEPNLVLEITNRGQTPAKSIDIMIAASIMNPCVPDTQWQELPETSRLQLVNSLVPNANLRPGHRLPPLTPEQQAAFTAGTAAFWFRGVVTFEDVFGGKYRKRFNGVLGGAEGSKRRLSRFGNDEIELPTT